MFNLGVVTSLELNQEIPSGILKQKMFQDGQKVDGEEVVFQYRDGRFFIPGERQPILSPEPFKEVDGEMLMVRYPRLGDTLMFRGFRTRSGFMIATGWGFYRQWRHIRDQMRLGMEQRSKPLRIGYEQLVAELVH